MERKAGWKVPSNEAERARRIALHAGVLDDGFHPIHQQGMVIWPLNEMVNVLFGEIIQSNFEARIELNPHQRLAVELPDVELPTKWELLDDLVLLPSDSFPNGDGDTWKAVCRALKVERVGRGAEIDSGPMRQSRAEILLGSHGWVNHKENGIRYVFDASKVMFSSGNITERRRMGGLDAAGDVVVDLFAGIGYYTLPILVNSGALVVHACEMNPDSIDGLTKGLVANMVMSRCHVHQGDNRQTAPKLEGIADRVLLGLLPSSTYAWELAFNCLKEEGGIIHVHMNVEQQDLDDGRFVKETLKSFEEMGSEVKLLHLEDVKSYAPRIRHVVLDVEVRKL